jgi:alkylation response protein AidB-like acyl-CoA dehydrogenase
VVSLLKRAGELDLLMIDVPEEYGGLELDKATNALVTETISAYGGFTGAFTTHTGVGTLPLIYYGTKAQKEKYLGREPCGGNGRGRQGMRLPGSGGSVPGSSTGSRLYRRVDENPHGFPHHPLKQSNADEWSDYSRGRKIWHGYWKQISGSGTVTISP